MKCDHTLTCQCAPCQDRQQQARYRADQQHRGYLAMLNIATMRRPADGTVDDPNPTPE